MLSGEDSERGAPSTARFGIESTPAQKEEEEEEGQSMSSTSDEGEELLRSRVDELEQPFGDKGLDAVLESIGTTRLQWLCVMILGLANAADAVEVLAIGYIITVFEDPVSHKRIDEQAVWSSLLTSSVFVGMLLGGLFSGAFGDRFGRKPLLTMSLVLNAFSALVSAMTPLLPASLQVPWLIFFRFVGGLGVGGSVPSAFSLGSELGAPSKRSLFINVIACFWSLGVLYTSLCAYLFLHGKGHETRWPWFAATVALPGMLAGLLCLLVLEESPTFLWMSGRSHDTRETLKRFLESSRAQKGTAAYAELRARIDVELSDDNSPRRATAGSEVVVASSGVSAARRAMEPLFVQPLRSRLFYLCGIFSCLSFAHYGISSWISDLFKKVHFDDPYLSSLFYTFATVPGLAAAIYWIDKVGRRALTIRSMVLACISALFFAFSAENRGFVVIGAIAFNGCAACAWNSLDVFGTELLPSKVRSTGIGISTACGRIGSVIATVLNSNILANHKDDEVGVEQVLAMAGLAMMLGALCAWKLPETLGSDASH